MAARPCILLAALLFSQATSAIELEELSVTESDGAYTLRIETLIDAPADYVYSVITDYRHAYRINPTVTEIEILPSGTKGTIRVRHLSEHRVGPFRFHINWAGDIVETRYGHLEVNTIPELSDFESGSASWQIRPEWRGTRVVHESTLKPDFFIPPLIGDFIMKRSLQEETLNTFRRIECHAQVMFDRDMENETDGLQSALTENRICTGTDDRETSLALEN